MRNKARRLRRRLVKVLGPGVRVDSNAELAARALLRQAEEARGSLAQLFQFVFREQATKLPVKTLAHQHVMFRFVESHLRCQIRTAVNTAKTTMTAMFGLRLLGSDVTERIAIVSATAEQAMRPLRIISDYITDEHLNPSLVMVYPWLRRGNRPNDVWTQHAITVERPAAIANASVTAFGIKGHVEGSRFTTVIADDVLGYNNACTAQLCHETHSEFEAKFLSRAEDRRRFRVVITNTPWSRHDMTFVLEAAGWPTLSMDVYGDVWFSNVNKRWLDSVSDLLRPSRHKAGRYRLRAHDPDPDERVVLWPERDDLHSLNELRAGSLPTEFARLYLCQPFDESAARCQGSWIEACKQRGLGLQLVRRYDGLNPVYTGVDVGIGQGKGNDRTCLFTFELLPDKSRRILNIESGRWSGPEIVERVVSHDERYGSIIAVESNTAQRWLNQFALERNVGLHVRAHDTNRINKHHLQFGVETIFIELKNRAWIIPCELDGSCHPEVKNWIRACVEYQPPPAHTDDELMACWIAREASRRGGGGRDPKPYTGPQLTMAAGGGF